MNIKPCPNCNKVPTLGYACGEYFIIETSNADDNCLCRSFNDMYASKDCEILAWNSLIKLYESNDSKELLK